MFDLIMESCPNPSGVHQERYRCPASLLKSPDTSIK